MRDYPFGPTRSQRYDVYRPAAAAPAPAPLAVLVHGGGWESGSRRDMVHHVPYFLAKGYVVANIGYRQSVEAPAPAAAEDVRVGVATVCARAAEWRADAAQLILMGVSAGAHLALLAALAPARAVGGPQSRALAVVSFFGITDVADLLEGENARDFARRWVPDQPGRMDLARRLSPVQYSASEAPGLCAVHSRYDPLVPYSQAERLVHMFQEARRPAQLITLPHKMHGVPLPDYPVIFEEVFRFLEREGLAR